MIFDKKIVLKIAPEIRYAQIGSRYLVCHNIDRCIDLGR